ncbi:MAG: hypothetical protein DMG21_04615 [Acidobacteria bacterium]|nr:MAG: hypothetical protein DMG21_04615 [Acidobacteriota bacterium]
MAKISDPYLEGFVVWVPVLPTGGYEAAAKRESSRIADPRVRQYYDPQTRAAKLFSGVLGLPRGSEGWDVYMVFAPGTRWDNKPPKPAYWMHQLGSAPPDLRLDGAKLEKVVEGMLRARKPLPAPAL